MHDNEQPVVKIEAFPCSGTLGSWSLSATKMCEVDPGNGEWAWIEEINQARTTGTTGQSQVEAKKIRGYCKSSDIFNRNLNNGRDWSANYQWKSMVCTNAKWVGQAAGTVWGSHDDCDKNLYCKLGTVWPYSAVCTALVTLNELCTDDYSCHPSLFCWYASASDAAVPTKRCIERYAKPNNYVFGWATGLDTSLTNQEYNGIHCTSGLAYNSNTNQATWVSTVNITQSGVVLAYPYACSPTDNLIPCRLNYGTGATDYIEVTCDCSTKSQGGYWNRIPGTAAFKNMTAERKRGYTDSECHTLDRDDYLALKDSCGNMKDRATWYEMYSINFNHTYWALMQDYNTSICFQSFIKQAPKNYDSHAVTLFPTVIFILSYTII